MKSWEIIIGELKEMNQSVATVNTSYSDTDFKIKWKEIKPIHTKTNYLITLNSEEHFLGCLESTSDQIVAIMNTNDTLVKTSLSAIVFLRKVNQDFLSNLDASISLGYNFVKANDLSQYSARSSLSYRTRKRSVSTSYNHIVSNQSDVVKTQHLDAHLIYNHYFKNKWFGLSEIN